MTTPFLVETPFGKIPDLGLLDTIPPKALISPQQICDAGLLSIRHQETLRSKGRLSYHKINGRVCYFASEFRQDFSRMIDAPDFEGLGAAGHAKVV